ncbi:unnamed protein product [Callosobruchus maculatus]|uniref:Uncharacterized protein n=1 Tax=Callosobruchus maculatus TaxID=64391 RepID=A0A653BV81_CALMS|nr:unnamed protein product [Callosobruchus maculatus]
MNLLTKEKKSGTLYVFFKFAHGVWYFAYKYGTRISVSFGDACVKSDHTKTKNGFEVFLEYYDSKKKKQSFVADVPLMKEGGSYFEVNSKEQNMHMYTVLLETDYENYLTEFFCLRGQSPFM